MKSDIDTRLIKQMLDSSTSQLAPATLEKLRGARMRAVEHQRIQHTVPVLAWLDHEGGKNHSFHLSKSTSWVIAALFVALLISGATFWRNYTADHDTTDVDIAILTDDLPIHAYVD